jgi:DNA end-binding protein Ku
MRPFWSGTLSFGLVSIPVELYPAQRPGGVSLRMLGPEGTPLTRRYVCPADDTVLDNDDLVRGYQLDNGEHVVVTDEELEALDPKKTRDIDLRRFVDRAQLDPLYFERVYFLTPGAEASKAYRLLAEVMERKQRAGIATFVLRDKERVLAIFAEGGLLRAQTMRFADEVRSVDEVELPKKPKLPKQLVQHMQDAIESLGEKTLDPKRLADASRQRLRALAKKKQAQGSDVVEAATAEKPQRGEVIDLMAVLKRSLQEHQDDRPHAHRRRVRKAQPQGSKSRHRANAG